jgi:acyl-coenzyme A synthetase/AMP-(fatty) acid ligase
VGDGYGSRISVTELEDAIFAHPAVHSVVVVGVWDEASATTLPTAFVVPTPAYRPWVGSSLTLDIEHHAANVLTYLLVSLALLPHSFTPVDFCYNP